MQELRSQLDAEKKRSDELEEELDDREKEVADLRRNLSDRDKELEQLRSALDLPEASVLLNKLKAKRKKATASLADIEAILEILEES